MEFVIETSQQLHVKRVVRAECMMKGFSKKLMHHLANLNIRQQPAQTDQCCCMLLFNILGMLTQKSWVALENVYCTNNTY